MVDWQSPHTLALDGLAELKVIHLIVGVYVWDWLLGIPYEYRLLKHKHEWRWPMFVYIGCRISTLGFAATLIACNSVGKLNCNAAIRASLVFSNIALATSSALIALRTVAIWHRRRTATIIAVALWVTNVVFLIRSLAIDPKVNWDSDQQSCGTYVNISISKPNIWISFATDLALIVVMIAGLWTCRGTGNLGRLVFTQGVVWCIVAVVCYIPSVVLLILDLNSPLTMITQAPTCIIMVLCTTKMQRQLAEYSPAPPNPSSVIRHDIKFVRSPVPSEESGNDNVTEPPPALLGMSQAGSFGSSSSDSNPSNGLLSRYTVASMV